MRCIRLVPVVPAHVAVVGALFASMPSLAAQSPGTDVFLGRLAVEGAAAAVSDWTNVTARSGYDNQPGFAPDSRTLLYTSQRQGQTDIYRYDLQSGETSAVTRTPESEYSPTVMPGGERFSTIRVEADSTQRLWSFDLSGDDPRLVFEDIAPVGYHAWLGDGLAALFVLGAPPTLHLADAGSGTSRVLAHDVGRSLHRVPDRTAVSYLHRDGGGARIRALDPETGGARDLARPVEGAEDYAWTPGGLLLMGSGSRLYVLDPLTDGTWRLVGDLKEAGIRDITRIAVSPDGSRIAVVASDP